MSGNPLMHLDSVGVHYRQRKSLFRHELITALEDVSFEIKHGETLGVIGRNGSGKSTLLRVLAGIYAPDVGSLHRFCERVSLLALNVGFDGELSGRYNVVLSGMLLGASRAEMLANMDRIVAFAELGDFIDAPVKTYSAGMRARLGFSVASHARTELLLIDEVLGVGDASFRRKAEAHMVERVRSDQTVVLVSHSVPQVTRLCDRVVWLEGGTVQQVGTTGEVVPAYEAFCESH